MEKRRMEKRKKEKRKMERRMELRLGVMELFLCIALVSEVACEERTVRYKIFEEVRPPTVIGTLAGNVTWSPDTTRALSGIRFKLMSPSTGSFIRFRESDGRLTVEERVDRERICKRNARCVITFDVAFVSAAQFELFHVEVEILDVNDNSPVFPRAECAVEISESAALGTRIALDAAEDADVGLNSIQSYHLSENSHFSVDVITRADGVKYAELVLIKELDRESRARYALKLVALDGGHPEKTGAVNITINVKDSNDNSPRFEHSHYSVDVPEDTQTESLILALTAVDPDDGPNGQVVYEFGKQVTTKIRQLFKLDYKTGFLTLQSPVDYEDERVYEIDVRASDLGHNPVPSLCKVTINIIDVNDNPPEIIITSIAAVTDGVAHVSEATGADILVALIGIGDRDGGANGQVSCTLNGGYGSFRLKRAYEGSYTIVTMAPLDREKIAEYNLTVVAEDFGVPPLRTVTHYDIRLTDVNDNAPVFNAQIYEGFIEENQLPGTYITTIVASDQDAGLNGEITYELFDSDTNGVSRFAIMNQAGNVYALQSFNYEVTKRLDLRVQASDRGWPQLHNNAVLVINIVDQNDNAPIITHPPLHNGSAEVQLPRDAPLGYIATRITANDADSGLNAELSYTLHDGSDLGFAIDPSTGEIYVNREIEEYDLWKLLVTVSDNGHPSQTSTATIHITLTESAPSNGNFYDEREEDGPKRWTLILILALTSFSLLFLVVLSYILCRSSKSVEKRCTDLRDAVDVPYSTEQRALDVPYSTEQNAVSVISSPGAFIGTPEKLRSSVQATVEGFSQTPQAFKSSYRGDIDGYSTLPGYGKDSARPITVWKGNSMMTIAVREPQISGKDSGKGDSDVNDSDSDISEGLKRDYTSYKGLWACTSECRILGHSDRCWSPSVSRTSGSSNTRNLSTFSRARSSYDTQTARSVALHSLTEDQQSQYDYIHICSPQSQRRDAEDKDGQEFTHTSHSPGRFTDTA